MRFRRKSRDLAVQDAGFLTTDYTDEHGYWILDAGCWMLDAGFFITDLEEEEEVDILGQVVGRGSWRAAFTRAFCSILWRVRTPTAVLALASRPA